MFEIWEIFRKSACLCNSDVSYRTVIRNQMLNFMATYGHRNDGQLTLTDCHQAPKHQLDLFTT